MAAAALLTRASWQAQRFRVPCCVFFANRIVRAASSGDKVQIPWQPLRFVRCNENCRSFAGNIGFQVASCGVHQKTRRKTSILKLRSVKIWRKSRAKCPFLPHVSSRVSGFPATSPCLLGKLQNLSFSKVSKQVVMSFCEAGAALCDIPTCLITCRKSFCAAGGRPNTFASFLQDQLQCGIVFTR